MKLGRDEGGKGRETGDRSQQPEAKGLSWSVSCLRSPVDWPASGQELQSGRARQFTFARRTSRAWYSLYSLALRGSEDSNTPRRYSYGSLPAIKP
jgi:hypothetical protein